MRISVLLLAICVTFVSLAGKEHEPSAIVKPRILISTDIGGTDPDDNQSMIHLLMYANEFDIEGLVSSPSFGDGSKEEILRMIDMYEQDFQCLAAGLRDSCGYQRGEFPPADSLRILCKQGRRGSAPLCGYAESTEGSEWIVKCAKKNDARPLWVLVWGALEDVAQALHDSPEIVDKIRVYWIGGPNKKWGSNAYTFIAENFPELWMIENNATYRGFIGSSRDTSEYGADYWKTFMKGAGIMGNDFVNYYGGNVKMGDSPSLFYLMDGDADRPESEHWGGSFEPVTEVPRYIISGPLAATDTVPCYSLLEWVLDGPKTSLPEDSVCFTLTIDRQTWPGHYIGNGKYMVRYAPKAPATLHYSIESELDGFVSHEGIVTVGNEWPASDRYKPHSATLTSKPIMVGCAKDTSGISTWYTDLQDYTTPWQGASTILRHRAAILSDWAKRFAWLRCRPSEDCICRENECK